MTTKLAPLLVPIPWLRTASSFFLIKPHDLQISLQARLTNHFYFASVAKQQAAKGKRRKHSANSNVRCTLHSSSICSNLVASTKITTMKPRTPDTLCTGHRWPKHLRETVVCPVWGICLMCANTAPTSVVPLVVKLRIQNPSQKRSLTLSTGLKYNRNKLYTS